MPRNFATELAEITERAWSRVARSSSLLVLVLAWLAAEPPQSRAQAAQLSLPDGADQTAGAKKSDWSAERQVSWKLLGPNILQDQKRIWLFPRGAVHGKHLLPTTGIVLATAGLVALDPHDDPYFRRTRTFSQFNRALSGTNTIVGMALVGVTTYGLGLARHDRYAQQTAQLTAEAILDAGIPALVARDVTRRLPPRLIPPNGDFGDSWFRRNKGLFYLGPGGFPSGHALSAFSIATVFSERYRRHRWVPWVAYGGASLVAFSRLTLQVHFPSDIFAGAVLAYVVSRNVVL